MNKKPNARASMVKQSTPLGNKEEVIFLDNYVHVIKEVEQNLWMVMVLQKEQSVDQVYQVN